MKRNVITHEETRWSPWGEIDSVGKHVTQEELQDAIGKEDARQSLQHRKTRLWMLALTAPSWGALIGATIGVPSVGSLVAAGSAVAIIALNKLNIFFQ